MLRKYFQTLKPQRDSELQKLFRGFLLPLLPLTNNLGQWWAPQGFSVKVKPFIIRNKSVSALIISISSWALFRLKVMWELRVKHMQAPFASENELIFLVWKEKSFIWRYSKATENSDHFKLNRQWWKGFSCHRELLSISFVLAAVVAKNHR